MQRTSYATMACSIARAVDVFAEPWTPLILRDIYVGLTRFDDIQANLGISRNVLAERVGRLVADGIVERRPYQERPPRHDYVLTEKGRDLVSVLFALTAWGDRWTAGEAGPPMYLRHDACGRRTTPQVTCACCGEVLDPGAVSIELGPGARKGRGTRLISPRLGLSERVR